MYMQVNSQNEELRIQLNERKSHEKVLKQQISKAEEKYLNLYEVHEKLKKFSNAKEMEDQLSSMQRKMTNVKCSFGSIDAIKIRCIEKVYFIYIILITV